MNAMTYFTMYSYNFCWPVRTLRVPDINDRWRPRTPAMAADQGVQTMKRFLSILILSTALFLFVGCSSTARPTPLEMTFVPAEGKQPPDPLVGPPYVTAKSWAVADGQTADVLWHQNGTEPRKIASTTKIMTAYLVTELALENPAILDETINVSPLAGDTSGSGARLEPADQVSVREMLYGLMLPSGNDAGNALAEHFNDRFKKPLPQDPEYYPPLEGDSRQNFIAEMTRRAKSLGMNDTFYRSPYNDQNDLDASRANLTQEEIRNSFTTTAADLARLAFNALKNPLFYHYVNTRRYVGTLKKPDGASRQVTWNNTNQLLDIQGFDGVKTGTTSAAGNCLVSHGTRGKDSLIIVVLGSTSGEGRYVDSRNLYRWAWLQLGHRRP